MAKMAAMSIYIFKPLKIFGSGISGTITSEFFYEVLEMCALPSLIM